MRVKIEEIQDQGLEYDEPIPAATLEDGLAQGYKLGNSPRLKAKFKRLSGRVLLHGGFDARVSAPCKRCLDEVALDLPVRFELSLVPELPKARDDDGEGEDDGRAARAGSFRLEDVDSEPFDGKTIQLDPIVREQLALALPVSVVCKEDCKGLCTVCGQDLNEKECGCERKVVDIRLAKLKDIKIN
jgi:uncharacterized protein